MFSHRYALGPLALLIVLFNINRRSFGQYTAVDLYTMNAPSGFTFPGVFDSSNPMDGTAVVGMGSAADSQLHALYWSLGNPPVELEPTNLSGFTMSIACGISGNQQVGYGGGPVTGLTNTTSNYHALLWTGAAASTVDLQPTNLLGFVGSSAYGTSGSQQVGSGQINGSSYHALLWNGTASSATDLDPAGTSSSNASVAYATDGSHQAGYVTITGSKNAYVWSGTAASGVDLSSSQFRDSVAYGVGGGQEVGYTTVLTGPARHATLWSGSANSAVDLNPSTFYDSVTFGTNGTLQVGYASIEAPNDIPQAMVWSGTAASAVNLGALLPSTIYSSIAYRVNAAGDVFGVATDKSGVGHVTEWVAPAHTASGTVSGGSNQSTTVAGRSPASGNVSVTFQSTSGGTFSNTSSLTTASNLATQTTPFNFALPSMSGLVQEWDLSFSGTFSGSASVTFHYDSSSLLPGTDPSTLQIEHFSNGQWVALPGAVDPVAETITVSTGSFSPFVLAETPEPASTALFALATLSVLAHRQRVLG